MKASPIILFDGVCNLCAGSVQFIINRDNKRIFSFCAMQSEKGKELLEAHDIEPGFMATFVVLAGTDCLTRSDAALRIARYLPGLWPLLSVLHVVPRPLRDWCYDIVARNRYRWFGKRVTCMVPTDVNLDRFID